MFKSREETAKCPFCNEADIHYIHSPIFLKFKKGSYGGSKQGITRTQEKIMVTDEECPNCHKSRSQLEKRLKDNKKEIPHEERIKRMRDAGLPTRIEE